VRRADVHEQPRQGLVGADRAHAWPEGGELTAQGLRERECPVVYDLASCRSTSFSPSSSVALAWPAVRPTSVYSRARKPLVSSRRPGRQHRDSFVGRHGEGLQFDQPSGGPL
jgi:hypothetical protein